MAAKYDPIVLQRLMGFTRQDAFNKVYETAKQSLPPEMAEKLDELKDELRTVDDLSLVLNRLFTEYGETLENHFMFFSFGGKQHIMVEMRQPGAWGRISRFARWCHENGHPLDEMVMTRMDWSMPGAAPTTPEEVPQPV
jgi:hypothetical protein